MIYFNNTPDSFWNNGWNTHSTLTIRIISLRKALPYERKCYEQYLKNELGEGVLVQVDPKTLAWFQAQGEDYEQKMAAALRIYAEAHTA